jgi:hypothetical protein
MARRPRNHLAGYPYHLTHRGNWKTRIFFDDVDRGVYLKLLRTHCKNPEILKFIRERTHTGQPCGSDEFARMLEAKCGRPLLNRKPGPKKKEVQKADSTPSLFPEDSEDE